MNTVLLLFVGPNVPTNTEPGIWLIVNVYCGKTPLAAKFIVPLSVLQIGCVRIAEAVKTLFTIGILDKVTTQPLTIPV